jgi:hypothetical protein
MDLRKDIDDAVAQIVGWDNLPIISIEKFGKELSVKTDRGEIFIPARKFFEQYEFRARVFEELGIILDKVDRKTYDKWLKMWIENVMKDLKVEDSDLIDTVETFITDHLDETTETDERYLKMGRPVLLSDNEVAFRSNDIITKLKSENFIVTNDQVYFILRRMNCESRRVLRNSIRVWVWRK